ncbi:YbbR-like domain-containing protein [Spirosoma fluminis]
MNFQQNAQPFQPTKALLCLAAAALFWFLNALNKTGYTLNVEYPVRFVYNDSLFIPTSPLPRTVTVNVSSDGWGLLRHSWLPFRVDPVDYVVKNPLQASVINTSSLTAALAEHVKKLQVNYVVADTLEMDFDRRMTKTIRLIPDSLHINMVPPYVVSSVINLTPRTIQVEGPARLVRGLADTLVVKIPRKRIADNYDEEVPLTNLRHPLLHSSADRVAVSFEVGELLSPLPTPPLAPTATQKPTSTQKSKPKTRTRR